MATLPALYVYLSENNGTALPLDVDRVWVYPAYVPAGTFESCTIDGGPDTFDWTTASWTGIVPAGTTAQLATRTSTDGVAWSGWSAALATSGSSITSPPGRYLQYQLQLTTSDSTLGPVIDAVTVATTRGAGDEDTTPPVISNVVASAVTTTSAVVSWTTDEPATSRVQFGPTTAYGQTTVDSTLTTSHSRVLTGLTAGTTYNFLVSSADASGNEASSTNDTLATVLASLSVGDVSLAEGNSGSAIASFPVTLSAPSGQTVTVTYTTADGTAVAPADYASATGTVTFAPGETAKAVGVTVNGDVAFEATETFILTLSAPQGATLGDAQGVGTITNDDTAPACRSTT